jgi:hypothetical protein
MPEIWTGERGAKTPSRSFPRDNDEHDGGQNEKKANDRKSQPDRAGISPNMPAWQDFQEEILYPVHPFSLRADHGPCTYRKARPGALAESGAVVLCPGGVSAGHFPA